MRKPTETAYIVRERGESMEAIVLPEMWSDWRVTEMIGAGAYGTVYRAENKTGEVCAIKIIQIPREQSEMEALQREYGDQESVNTFLSQVVQDFEAEIDAMECLKDNEYIVQIQDYQVIRSEEDMHWKIFIRMEYLKTLFDYKAGQGMDEEEVRKLGMDICRALCACEEQHILHRDIKPDNIMVSKDGRFKLGDFGVARHMDRTTSSLSLKGTFGFMAPEVYYGNRYDRTADIYSLGLVMYRLLNNNRDPFVDPGKRMVNFKDRQEAMNQRMQGTREMPVPVNASEMMGKIILRACAHDKENRFSSAKDFLKALETMTLAEVAVSSSAIGNNTDTSGEAPAGKRKNVLAGIVGGMAVAIAASGIFICFHKVQNKPVTINLNEYIGLELAAGEDIYDGEGYATLNIDWDQLEEDYGELLRTNLLKNMDTYFGKYYDENNETVAELKEALQGLQAGETIEFEGNKYRVSEIFLKGLYADDESVQFPGCIDLMSMAVPFKVNNSIDEYVNSSDIQYNLYNGDIVSVNYSTDNDIAEQSYGVQVTYDKIEVTQQGLKEYEPDQYQWVTSYDQIPEESIEKIKQAAMDYLQTYSYGSEEYVGYYFLTSNENQENRLILIYRDAEDSGNEGHFYQAVVFSHLFYDQDFLHYFLLTGREEWGSRTYENLKVSLDAVYGNEYTIVEDTVVNMD